jgi:glycosyltransferase involved in cell wall biosynthesis
LTGFGDIPSRVCFIFHTELPDFGIEDPIMRLLIVAKRRPQQRDLIERPYGRFYHLPAGMAALGHEVRVLLVSHHRLPSQHARKAEVEWFSDDIRTLGPISLFRTLKDKARTFRPDWVIGMSDAQYGWLARRLANDTGARLAVDAYDNYEAYMPWNVPLHRMWRRAIRHADLVTAAGPQLADLLQSHRVGGEPTHIIPMAADPEFVPLDRQQSRRDLGLEANAKLLGYIGSWSKSRGSSMLIDAFRKMRSNHPGLRLVVSGRPPAEVLQEPGVLGTGYVADAKLPALINALDIACVITANTPFGSYSYPGKLCEAMACGVPVVATSTAPVDWMLGRRAQHLIPTGDVDAFVQRAQELLSKPIADYGVRITWEAQAQQLSRLLARS